MWIGLSADGRPGSSTKRRKVMKTQRRVATLAAAIAAFRDPLRGNSVVERNFEKALGFNR